MCGRHLTEVEARLERAEVLLQQMRALVPPQLRTWERAGSTSAASRPKTDETFDFSRDPPQPKIRHDEPSANEQARRTSVPCQPSHPHVDESSGTARQPDADHQRLLEGPPLEDFEWSEKNSPYARGLSPDAFGEGGMDDTPISDGMASLSVNEREGGYLGVASGAALLRLLEPNSRRRPPPRPDYDASPLLPMISQPNPNHHIAESMIDAYFRLYHVSYPLVHEPTFRAQYSEVIARPNGPCWTALAYIVAAIGVWASGSSSADTLDLALFAQARSILGFNFLEVGNLSLVQALTLASNYQQKRDKPNSGYNYLGLSARMAMGLGLHKEFQGWNIAPLSMEIRRRIWWTLCSFDIGASITFSRPDAWPYKGVEVSYPLNVNDKDLTAASLSYPSESNQITPYTSVATQARFHIATHECYEKVISKPFPSAEELLRLDAEHIESFKATVPSYFVEQAAVPPRYALPHAVMACRLRNLRIIMYRPFVIRRALRRKPDADEASATAYDRCLADAKSTIQMIADFWERHEHNRLSAWYGLYFVFQAALIPCICLRNDPTAPEAEDWRWQISTTLEVITGMAALNASSSRCHRIIYDLCGRFLDSSKAEKVSSQVETQAEFVATTHAPTQSAASLQPYADSQPVGESPETQINNVFSMMWPNVPPLEAADVVMGDDTGWMEFLRAGSVDDWNEPLG
ncbi:Regulatory protein GAL4 [Tolypocladium paradoxum]|uniref:Regulatory protein GAL4 n=1 Tax=Tolypocladium paradoxum TaxID=94208 RepID=A0A2S4L3G0_9HYPO|nr:Regulatory protein GAL4 [Tolypocladium paradoxum]